jgi:hypothetical protein
MSALAGCPHLALGAKANWFGKKTGFEKSNVKFPLIV